MDIKENVSLKDYSTMRLGGQARYLANITDRNQLPEAIKWAEKRSLPVVMVGLGSNIVWGDNGYSGLVLVNNIKGFQTYPIDDRNIFATVGAGENWDETVAKTIDLGFSGLELLSLIPGTVGATPIQNVGAYGKEVKDVLATLEAYDNQEKTFVNLRSDDCDFGYRTSRFKKIDKGRFFITSVTFHLTNSSPQPPFYSALQKYLDDNQIKDITPKTIRQAVIDIRNSKLPDPATVANNGSFFANPIIPRTQFEQLRSSFPNMPFWELENDNIKLSAAWLVEQAGFKGVHDNDTGMATWDAQPLVLVNETAKNTADLIKFRDSILAAVKSKFSLVLEQEPELISV